MFNSIGLKFNEHLRGNSRALRGTSLTESKDRKFRLTAYDNRVESLPWHQGFYLYSCTDLFSLLSLYKYVTYINYQSIITKIDYKRCIPKYEAMLQPPEYIYIYFFYLFSVSYRVINKYCEIIFRSHYFYPIFSWNSIERGVRFIRGTPVT